MKIYVSFRITKERSNLLITDALERGGGFADGVHLDWKEKIDLANEHRQNIHICQRKNHKTKQTDQGGAVGAGVGRGQGDQGRDQDPGFHR